MNANNRLWALLFTIFWAAQAAAQNPADERARMRLADGDGDGVVTREEFANTRSGRFSELDIDDSDGLSQEEFAVALEGTRMQRFAAIGFRRADSNDDDNISHSEWDAMPTRAFDRLDANGDGQVDQTELAR